MEPFLLGIGQLTSRQQVLQKGLLPGKIDAEELLLQLGVVVEQLC